MSGAPAGESPNRSAAVAAPASGKPAAGGSAEPATAAPVPGTGADAVPATRLDVNLNFTNRPVRDLYRVLGEAHGIRFVIQPVVNQMARVTLDCSGRSLPEAIVALERAMSHRITRVRDGIYMVSATAGGANLSDAQVQEEDLAPAEPPP